MVIEKRSGNGWVTCGRGHQHWGVFGAAGVLVYAPDPGDRAESLVLLQHRARWSHQGGTWSVPGGAMDSDETPAEAALREADEECMLDPRLVVPRGMYSQEHGGWSYHTILAQASESLRVYSDAHESDEVVWLPAGQVDQLNLHPGFAASWPVLRAALPPLTVFVDGTGGAGPDTAAGPAEDGGRLRAHLTRLTRCGLAALPDGLAAPVLARWYPDYVLVLDGPAAAAVPVPAPAGEADEVNGTARPLGNEPPVVRTARVRIVAAGDRAQAADAITDLAGTTPGRRLVVSGCRDVRDRAAAAGACVAGMEWLLGLLPPAGPAT